MSKPISQREAQRLRKRVRDLEERERTRRQTWRSEYSGGAHFWSLTNLDGSTMAAIKTALRLDHAVIVRLDSEALRFIAMPLEGKP